MAQVFLSVGYWFHGALSWALSMSHCCAQDIRFFVISPSTKHSKASHITELYPLTTSLWWASSGKEPSAHLGANKRSVGSTEGRHSAFVAASLPCSPVTIWSPARSATEKAHDHMTVWLLHPMAPEGPTVLNHSQLTQRITGSRGRSIPDLSVQTNGGCRCVGAREGRLEDWRQM